MLVFTSKELGSAEPHSLTAMLKAVLSPVRRRVSKKE